MANSGLGMNYIIKICIYVYYIIMLVLFDLKYLIVYDHISIMKIRN